MGGGLCLCGGYGGGQGRGSTAAVFSSLALPKCLCIKSCPRTWLMTGETLDPWLVCVKTTEVFVKTQALSQEILIQKV